MLKEHLVYEDFDGNKRERDFYFNLTPQEVSEMEASHKGGMSTFLSRIMGEKDETEVVKYFKEFLLMAYGKKSDDGESFVKNDQIREEFKSSMAFSELWMRFLTEEHAFENFVKGVLPKDMDKYIAKMEKMSAVQVVNNAANNNPGN